MCKFMNDMKLITKTVDNECLGIVQDGGIPSDLEDKASPAQRIVCIWIGKMSEMMNV